MMYAIMSDIHANYVALEAVLRDIETIGGVQEIWCLGDTVGYGPEPAKCIQLLKQYNASCVAGNHDQAAVGKLETIDFNPVAGLLIPVKTATIPFQTGHLSGQIGHPLERVW